MTTEKILQVVKRYRGLLEQSGISKERMDPGKAFAELTSRQLLAHAHYLLDGIEQYARDPEKIGKTGRHLGSVQTLLSVAGIFTLRELMDHNRP